MDLFNKKISRRKFIKYSLITTGGLFLYNAINKPYAMANKYFQKMTENDKFIKEAKYYIKTQRGYECELCPNYCILKEGKLSSCNTRMPDNGKLYTVAYNNPCSVNIDPIEKKPLYHFYPKSKSFSVAIAGCNLHCLNCQNYSISQVSPLETRNYSLTPEQLIKQAKASGCLSIPYTYSDPIAFYEYTYDASKIAKQQGIKNVFISAGYINEKPLRDIAKYLDAANIDLKSFNDETYKKLNAGGLKTILNTLKILHEEGVWLEITYLVVPTWNDKMDEIKKMCEWLYDNDLYNYPLHFSRFFPMYKLTNVPPTPLETLENARKIALDSGINYVYIGNVPGNKGTNTYCPSCNKTLISRKGYFILENNIENSKCKFCGESIHGRWQ
ncbi:MAG: AmmeMemoRadiSam system radical SAM enzyme [Marinilabiliales bacterium]